MPDIQSLYKADVDNILEKLVSIGNNANELDEYFESGDYETYIKNIESILADGELTISDLMSAQKNEGQAYFKDLIENDKSDEMQYYNLFKIRENVYQYLSTISKNKLNDANLDLNLL